MSGCRRFTDEGLLVLLQSAGGVVEELNLSRCLQVRVVFSFKPSSLYSLTPLPAQITNLGLMPLRGRAHRGKLTVLNLDGLTRTR